MTLNEFLGKLKGLKRNRDGCMAYCPAHDDKSQSLSVNEGDDGRILLKCFAGCETKAVLAALGLTERDLFSEGTRKESRSNGLTLAEYARAKRIPAEFLRELGVKQAERRGRPAVEVPYLGTDGAVTCRRFRLAMTGENKFAWEKGAKVSPYGLWRLAGARGLGCITLVEGESDAQTLWHHGEPALGIPGAATWRDEWAAYLSGFSGIYAVIEPDAGGRGFQAKLLQSPLRDRLWFVTLPGAKDVSELHCLNPEVFKERWKEAVANAVSAKQVIARLLDDLVTYVRRFVVVSEAQARVIALWVAHTRALDAADATPYLSVTSAEKQSGKTRLLEVLETAVSSPWLTGRVTAAVLTRKIDAEHPTLLLDESDAAFSGEKEYAEALRGVLNTGHRRGGKASCCVGQGASISFRDFSTFCPKAIAGIGKLPDTVADRAIPVRLKRKAPDERVERFRLRDVQTESSRLRSELQAWAAGAIEDLRAARPHLPEQLSDRQQDGAEPLLAIADTAGGGWPDAARSALKELLVGAQTEDQSTGVGLLADIRDIFAKRQADLIASAKLAETLAQIETSPWGEWSQGKPITPTQVAKLLRPYGISPGSVRIGAKTPKGYQLDQFRDAFKRYLHPDVPAASPSPTSVNATPQQAANNAGSSHCSDRNTTDTVAAQESDNPNDLSDVAGVAVSSPSTEPGDVSADAVNVEKEWSF